jgi:hypothetical protein
MGYTTEFEGKFKLDRQLTDNHKNYLLKFSETRRMKRSEEKASKLSDPLREAVSLPIGYQGEYFVGGTGSWGQDHDNSIIDYNNQARTQPGLWCQWIPSDDGLYIEWNQGEKFYHYIEWLAYLIENFLIPWGYTLNGKVNWQGESNDDIGQIIVKDNTIRTSNTIKEIIE